MKADPLAYPPRGLSREEAARYIGVGPSKFDEMVADGRMPKPKRIDSRTVWDRVALDVHFSSLSEEKDDLAALVARSRKVTRLA